MSRPMIHCPQCQRELFNLHRPQCLWCGARLTEAKFEQLAESPGPPPPLPMPSPLTISGISWFGRGGGLLARLAVGVAICVIMMLAHLAETAWHLWRHSHLPPVH